MNRIATRIVLSVFLLVLLHLTGAARGEQIPASIEVRAVGKNKLLVKFSQEVSGEGGWRKDVELVVPRRRDVVRAGQIVSYKSATLFNNGDSSRASFPPSFGFILFGSDQQGPTIEIRLIELYDKRDFVASSINGVYRFTYPDSSK
jgi:hypothetical protein